MTVLILIYLTISLSGHANLVYWSFYSGEFVVCWYTN